MIAAGTYHSLAIQKDGSLWAWGRNDFGQLGLGSADFNPHSTPTRVGTATNWVAVVAGGYHSLGLRADGTLWAWGYNYYGQLGLGVPDTTDRHIPAQVGSSTNWVAIAAGSYHSLGLRADGTLWSWGNNFNGQLGLADNTDRHIPTRY